MITWFTQPPDNFASCYAYNERYRELVRIRLELNRHDFSSPKIYRSNNHYVGFSSRYLSRSNRHWTVENGNICYDDRKLHVYPHAGKAPYDFQLNSNRHPDFVHWGNDVTESPVLPGTITPDELKNLAAAILDSETYSFGSYELTHWNSSKSDLENVLHEWLIRLGIRNKRDTLLNKKLRFKTGVTR